MQVKIDSEGAIVTVDKSDVGSVKVAGFPHGRNEVVEMTPNEAMLLSEALRVAANS